MVDVFPLTFLVEAKIKQNRYKQNRIKTLLNLIPLNHLEHLQENENSFGTELPMFMMKNRFWPSLHFEIVKLVIDINGPFNRLLFFTRIYSLSFSP